MKQHASNLEPETVVTYMKTIHRNLTDEDITDLIGENNVNTESLRPLVRKAVEEVTKQKEVFELHDVLEVLIDRYKVEVPDIVKVNGKLHSDLIYNILRDMVVYGELSDKIYYSRWSARFVVKNGHLAR